MLIQPTALALYGETFEDSETATVNELIESASSAITSAAGTGILAETSAIEVLGLNERLLNLPGAPIRRVDEIRADGELIDPNTYRVASNGVYRAQGWACGAALPTLRITYFHGFDVTPKDIQTLCASMVIAGLIASREGGWDLQNGRMSSMGVDDYREAYATSGEGVEQVTPMDLPERTRKALRKRFGGSVAVVNSL
ncbi:hypothetical protein [Brevibacterium permense]|uniref:Head-tail connector protein n=1 Tax=Brevibacterium permense TaxID=234834 RepID=A0ABP4L158_9MICO|nr:hypothetical protein [Brevibacterium permense]